MTEAREALDRILLQGKEYTLFLVVGSWAYGFNFTRENGYDEYMQALETRSGTCGRISEVKLFAYELNNTLNSASNLCKEKKAIFEHAQASFLLQ